MKQKTLYSIFLKVAVTMSKQPERYNLNSVLLEYKDKELNFVSTDGLRMVFINFNTEQITKNDITINFKNDTNILFSSNFVKNIIKTFNIDNKNFDNIVNIKIEDDIITINNDFSTIKDKILDEDFPEYRRVIPSDIYCNFSDSVISFDSKFLGDIKNIFNGEAVTIKLGSDNKCPIVVTHMNYYHFTLKYILMPVRTS